MSSESEASLTHTQAVISIADCIPELIGGIGYERIRSG